MMPIWAKPMISAPSEAPIAEPYPPGADKARRLVGDVEPHRVREKPSDADVHPAEDEERGEGDDEARQLGPHHEHAVRRPDDAGEDQHGHYGHPHVDLLPRDKHAEQQAAGPGHDAR